MTHKSTLIRSVSAAAVLVTAFSAAAQACAAAENAVTNTAAALTERIKVDLCVIQSVPFEGCSEGKKKKRRSQALLS